MNLLITLGVMSFGAFLSSFLLALYYLLREKQDKSYIMISLLSLAISGICLGMAF